MVKIQSSIPEATVSWWQINNWVPIVASAVMIALSFGAIITRVAVLENKVDTLTSLIAAGPSKTDIDTAKIVEENTNRITNLEAEYAALKDRIDRSGVK